LQIEIAELGIGNDIAAALAQAVEPAVFDCPASAVSHEFSERLTPASVFRARSAFAF
jgi:hypothetical protein